jgi:hypothetical protein
MNLFIKDMSIVSFERLDPLEVATHEDVDSFLNEIVGDDDLSRDTSIAAGLLDANFGRQPPLPDTLIIVPVAIQADVVRIESALAQYAKQKECDPFAIHLHLNWPSTFREFSNLQRAEEIINSARILYPKLDIRVSRIGYDNPTIGRIRRAAWNGTLFALDFDGANFDHTIGINHDIDLEWISSRYIKNIQHFYKQFPPNALLPVTSTEARHATSPDHPNISRAVFWKDFSWRVMNFAFEASLVVPFKFYAERNGFRPGDATYETSAFTDGASEKLTMIKGTGLLTDNRRYVTRLEKFGYDGIWTNDSFSSDDWVENDPNKVPDISEEILWQIIAEDVELFSKEYMENIFSRLEDNELFLLLDGTPLQKEFVIQSIVEKTRKMAKLARFVLDRGLHLTPIGTHLFEHHFSEENIRYNIFLFTHRHSY